MRVQAVRKKIHSLRKALKKKAKEALASPNAKGPNTGVSSASPGGGGGAVKVANWSAKGDGIRSCLAPSVFIH